MSESRERCVVCDLHEMADAVRKAERRQRIGDAIETACAWAWLPLLAAVFVFGFAN